MDTARKIFASLIFSVAVIALINFIGNVLVGGGDMAQNQGVEETQEAAPAPVATVDATADTATKPAPAITVAQALTVDEESAKMGSGIFRKKCLGCHPILQDGGNRTGPNLFGILGREKAILDGYRYSGALKRVGGTWTEENMNSFIAGPRAMVPDTKMTFAGLKKNDQRVDVIAYLRTLSN